MSFASDISYFNDPAEQRGKMMKNILASCCCACILVTWVSGQSVDISGKVVDEKAAAIPGAAVRLLINGTSAVTDNNGAYHLSSTALSHGRLPGVKTTAVYVTGSGLRVSCASPARISAALFALNGRLLAQTEPLRVPAGVHTIPLGQAFFRVRGFSCGILAVTVDNLQYRARVMLPGCGVFCIAHDRRYAAKAAADVIIDTIRITKAGYDTVNLCIGQYTDAMPDVYLTTPAGYPRMVLNNAATVLTIYKPDAKNGYCRGSRFDWSGIIGRVVTKGHSWYADYTGGTHDPLAEPTGTAGEFGIDSALGYGNQAFLKIGVGKLQGTGGTYNFRTNYQILDPGVWIITRGKYWVQFSHQLAAVNGYDYDYVKRITLSDSAPVYTLDYDLKNTGTKKIVTDHYAHNITLIDDKPVAGNYRVTLGFPPSFIGQTSAPGSWGSMTTISGKVITITATLNGSDYLWANFSGLTGTAADNYAVVEETTGLAALKIEGAWVPNKYNFWASPRSVCPEPYSSINLAAGAEITWKDTYTAYPDGVK
jgi:hypothetical protein